MPLWLGTGGVIVGIEDGDGPFLMDVFTLSSHALN